MKLLSLSRSDVIAIGRGEWVRHAGALTGKNAPTEADLFRAGYMLIVAGHIGIWPAKLFPVTSP
jgi:hypothetical protein